MQNKRVKEEKPERDIREKKLIAGTSATAQKRCFVCSAVLRASPDIAAGCKKIVKHQNTIQKKKMKPQQQQQQQKQ